MGRSMGGGGRSSGGGSRGGGSRSGGSRSSSGHSMGGSRSGTSRAFGSGHSGGSPVRGTGRSYSGQTSNGNPMMGNGGFGGPRGGSGGPQGGYGGPHGGPGFHNPPPPPPSHHHYHRRHYYGGSNRVYVHHSSSGSLLGVIIVFIILAAILSSSSMYRRSNNMYYKYKTPSYQDSYSKAERQKFTGQVKLNGFYSDPDGILYDDEISSLEKGLEHFYETTGVCAYVYFVEALDPNVDGIDYASSLYDELFSDEGHILLLYDYNNAYMYDACGYAIGTTIDTEAIDIIYDYVEAAWANDSENLGDIFGGGCARAADRMMYKPKTFAQKYMPIIIVVIVAIALIIIVNVIFKLYKAKVAQKNKEQEDLERTLSTPLETFGETPIDELAKKYEDSSSNNAN